MQMKSDESKEELAALLAVGVAENSEIMDFERLSQGDPQLVDLSEELTDIAASAMAAALRPARPARSLRERVMVATEPELARVATDSHGCITSISKGFTDLCGYTLDEVRGRKPGTFLQGPGTDASAIESLRKAIRSRVPCEVEILNYHKSGSPYLVRISMQPIHGEDGSLEGFTATETKMKTVPDVPKLPASQ